MFFNKRAVRRVIRRQANSSTYRAGVMSSKAENVRPVPGFYEPGLGHFRGQGDRAVILGAGLRLNNLAPHLITYTEMIPAFIR